MKQNWEFCFTPCFSGFSSIAIGYVRGKIRKSAKENSLFFRAFSLDETLFPIVFQIWNTSG